ncbi:MAG: hypothetical protein J7642_08940 [Cyanobacteria bacterium SBC]|nr:hypothetical protein [Cyanobacteria bacterium SBC]
MKLFPFLGLATALMPLLISRPTFASTKPIEIPPDFDRSTISQDRTFREQFRLDGTMGGALWDVRFSPDRRSIVVAASYDLILWQGDGTQQLDSERHSLPIRFVEYSPDGTTIAAAVTTPDEAFEIDNRYKTVEIWRVANDRFESVRSIVHGAWVEKLQFSPDGQFLATLGRDRQLKLWDNNGRNINTIAATDFAFVANSEQWVTGDRTGRVKIWKMDRTRVRSSGEFDTGAPITGIGVRRDGQYIATGDDRGEVTLWTREGERLMVLPANGDRVSQLQFSSDGEFLISISNGWVRRWHLERQTVMAQRGDLARWSPNGQLLAIASDDRKNVTVWDRAGSLVRSIEIDNFCYGGVRFSPDSTGLGVTDGDNLRVWGF